MVHLSFFAFLPLWLWPFTPLIRALLDPAMVPHTMNPVFLACGIGCARLSTLLFSQFRSPGGSRPIWRQPLESAFPARRAAGTARTTQILDPDVPEHVEDVRLLENASICRIRPGRPPGCTSDTEQSQARCVHIPHPRTVYLARLGADRGVPASMPIRGTRGANSL